MSQGQGEDYHHARNMVQGQASGKSVIIRCTEQSSRVPALAHAVCCVVGPVPVVLIERSPYRTTGSTSSQQRRCSSTLLQQGPESWMRNSRGPRSPPQGIAMQSKPGCSSSMSLLLLRSLRPLNAWSRALHLCAFALCTLQLSARYILAYPHEHAGKS